MTVRSTSPGPNLSVEPELLAPFWSAEHGWSDPWWFGEREWSDVDVPDGTKI